MLAFPNKIMIVGFGSVVRCTLPILLKHIKVDPQDITIMDFEPDDRQKPRDARKSRHPARPAPVAR